MKEKDLELKRLEEALLREERPQEEDFPFDDGDTTPAETHAPYRNFANGYRAYTNQPSDVDMEDYSEEVRAGDKSSSAPLMILALVLIIAILLVLCWWVVRYMGVLG